ncbi:Hint domain-containing protein [Paracoccus albus]|uniref:Hint domain-containing protein n=1 Tax=Paracoccus albus TaxID=3017784 RepID=UPI0022F0EB9D|nr:Hint domain-containing protein [Paracoccus albus]WBU61417.1 Hint domain-containing protein [Paracoccus albus]
MAYLIKAYTFEEKVPANNDFPYWGITSVSFADAAEQDIYLDDPDNSFDAVSTHEKLGQQVLRDVVISGETVHEGSVLTFLKDKLVLIIDRETNAEYLVMLPRTIGRKYKLSTDIGDRTTVLVVPAEGTTQQFDPARTYKVSIPVNGRNIPMQPTEIPQSYLGTICFGAGTLIMTAYGPRRVEELSAGDLILTRDRGPRPLCWIGHRHVSARVLDLAPNLRAVRILKGALGNGYPDQDLTVSPQHRVLIDSPVAERICGAAEGLVAAKHLCGMPGISIEDPPEGVDYYHLLFDRHELVQSNGCWTESLFTGPEALKAVSPSARREIQTLFPQLFADPSTPRNGVRRFLSGREVKELIRRHRKNAKPLLA